MRLLRRTLHDAREVNARRDSGLLNAEVQKRTTPLMNRPGVVLSFRTAPIGYLFSVMNTDVLRVRNLIGAWR